MVTLVGISGSLRQGSYNSALLRAAEGLLPGGVTLVTATIRGIRSTTATSRRPTASRRRSRH